MISVFIPKKQLSTTESSVVFNLTRVDLNRFEDILEDPFLITARERIDGIDSWIVLRDVPSLLSFILRNIDCRTIDDLMQLSVGEIIMELVNSVGDSCGSFRVKDYNVFPEPKEGKHIDSYNGWPVPASMLYLSYFYFKYGEKEIPDEILPEVSYLAYVTQELIDQANR